MKNTILEQNISCLPDKLRILLPENENNPRSLQVVQGEQGWPVARVQIGTQTIHTNSLIDPWQEASHWADTLDYKDVMVSFIYGCGFGYPLIEYAKRKQPYTETIVFERNIDLFYTMLSRIDIRDLLQNPTFHFVIGDPSQMKTLLSDILTSDFLLRVSKPACFFTWLAHRNEKEAYLKIHEWLWSTLELNITGIGNSVHDTLVGMYNMLDNVESVLRSPRLSSLRDTFKGKPAIIVSNGPSLDKNLELLAQAKGKALILTAESALKPCLKRNIQPDAVCVVERTPSSYEVHFKQAQLPSDLVLVGLHLMDPRIPVEFPGPWIPVFRSYESTSKWINEAVSDGCGLSGGSSSAHLAFEFALWVGANPIIFVGQDLSFGPDYSTHSKLSSYSEEYMAQHVQIIQSQPTFWVKGVDGNLIPTIKIWYEFKTWFEQQIAQYPDRRFIDATEGGAYIEGTELMPLQQAIHLYCQEHLPMNLYDKVKDLVPKDSPHDRRKKYEDLLSRIQWIRNRLHQLTIEADTDIRNCKLVQKACALQVKYAGSLPAFVESLYNHNSHAFRKYGSNEEIVTFTQSIIFAFHKLINDIGEVDTVERLLKVTEIQQKMYEYLKETCLRLIQHFDLADRRIREQMEKEGGTDVKSF
ncbi:hypothetical protein DNHGIG_20190 [Collibacillus ludicampi]|uniref:6-hydroxymethylpterin diphosphokinase MptE-like domain-containing protein n=1 Tax=Collibacillus ludicampi TaxID=2771369 RepID=A0AAV4LFA3_9BACL|nr:6-hydroxymethylpterin diphosphokinase MptE-like protein [Collibacillus ludicampi]GIM46470.1 hypothetical protein DNHGIG_20190 [Collibacillus ludicampi]